MARKYVYGPGIDMPFGGPRVHAAAGADGVWLTGDDVVAAQPASAFGNAYMFTGRRWDEESGLYYYRARMYSLEIGRFLQPDPLMYVDGMNYYAYVNNNPVNWVDPWGLCKDDVQELTDEDLVEALQDFWDNYLKDFPRFPTLDGDFWINTDTKYHDPPHRDRTYRYRGEEYKGTEVNYIGVGAASRHRHMHGPWRYALTEIHNRVNNGVPPTPGEHFFGKRGRQLYPQIKR